MHITLIEKLSQNIPSYKRFGNVLKRYLKITEPLSRIKEEVRHVFCANYDEFMESWEKTLLKIKVAKMLVESD
jgi:hypothetical protein